jgi:hypothetical protein
MVTTKRKHGNELARCALIGGVNARVPGGVGFNQGLALITGTTCSRFAVRWHPENARQGIQAVIARGGGATRGFTRTPARGTHC